MVYATYSQGFRPGGINRRSTLAPYSSDYVYNYEAGWKTEIPMIEEWLGKFGEKLPQDLKDEFEGRKKRVGA